ncbi:MAG: S8 family serine peptidase [Deltaproteobacteria bacterium]|nr:S8 family serine peptidase [Deltaproteobacteria bacterium]
MNQRIHLALRALFLGLLFLGLLFLGQPALSSPHVYWALYPSSCVPGEGDPGDGETGDGDTGSDETGDGETGDGETGDGETGGDEVKEGGKGDVVLGVEGSKSGAMGGGQLGSPPAFIVQAGDYGEFHFGFEELLGCSGALAQGHEDVAVYPHPGPAPFDIDCMVGDACATAPDDVVADWVAILDWDNWHGRAVDQVVRSTTDPSIQTVLIPLESRILPSPEITDVDFLLSIAGLVDLLDDGLRRPLMMNMSFGRLHDTTDPVSTSCQPHRLSCQISRLLNHLAQPSGSLEPRTTLVAAAGNHRNPLFPAGLEGVVSVGALDLTQYTKDGIAQASWETPVLPGFPEALMPGSALCMSVVSGGHLETTMAPSGSSFSSAFFAGWLADAFLWEPAEVRAHLDLGAGWGTEKNCTSDPTCPYALAHEGKLFDSPSGKGGQRMAEVLTQDPRTCGPPSVPIVSIAANLVYAGSSDGSVGTSPLNRLSLIGLVADQLKPAPLPITCVSCSLCCESSFSTDFRSGTEVGEESKPRGGLVSGKSAIVGQTGPVELQVDLHNGWALPDNMELETMYARIPPQLLRLDLNEEELDQIQAGEVSYLDLSGDIQTPDLSSQLSMISVIRLYDPDSETHSYFWNATPLLLQD